MPISAKAYALLISVSTIDTGVQIKASGMNLLCFDHFDGLVSLIPLAAELIHIEGLNDRTKVSSLRQRSS